MKKMWRPFFSFLSAFLIVYIIFTRDSLNTSEVELIEYLISFPVVYAISRSVEKIKGVER